MPSSVVVLVALRDVGGWDGELSIDLVKRILGRREAELALKQGGFGRIAVRA
jgi:hypothetical protein